MLVIRTKICDFFQISNFKKYLHSLGHRVVKIKPNLIWIIPSVPIV